MPPLRRLPFDDPDRIMLIDTRDAQGRTFGVSEPDFEDWRRATRTFSGISLVQMGLSMSAATSAHLAVMACLWPARRATRLDPMKALRYQ